MCGYSLFVGDKKGILPIKNCISNLKKFLAIVMAHIVVTIATWLFLHYITS